MTDLETRIRDLRVEVEVPEGLSPAELRQRAATRGRRRVSSRAAVTVLLMVGAAIVVVTVLEDDPDVDQVTTGPDPSTGGAEATPNIPFGDVTGVVVNVSPREDLIDGQEVEVSIEGLENLPGAYIVQCAGDVTSADAAESCDLGAVERLDLPDAAVTAEPHQVVSVSRTLHIVRGAEDSYTRPYDCATEPAGCVLIVAPMDTPRRGVAVPLTFKDVPPPEQEVAAVVEPDTGLQDGQDVEVIVEGLTPNRVFWMTVCELAPGEPAGPDRHCDWWSVEETSSEEGTLTGTVTARSAIYDNVAGRTDCTAVSCAVAVFESGGMAAGASVSEHPISFADGVVAPVPVLELDPPGPYEDRQRITVRGRGFPPGVSLAPGEGLVQCVPSRESSMPELCGGLDYEVNVGADGTFTRTVWVNSGLGFPDSCTVDPGCVLGWVIDKGSLLVSVPLDFE